MSSPDGPVTAAGSPQAAIVDDAAADPRVSGLPPVTSGAVRTYRGMPLTGTDGDVVGALCVFGPQPRSWTDGDRVLLRQLADSVATELELSPLAREFEAHRLRFEPAIDAADRAAGGAGLSGRAQPRGSSAQTTLACSLTYQPCAVASSAIR